MQPGLFLISFFLHICLSYVNLPGIVWFASVCTKLVSFFAHNQGLNILPIMDDIVFCSLLNQVFRLCCAEKMKFKEENICMCAAVWLIPVNQDVL